MDWNYSYRGKKIMLHGKTENRLEILDANRRCDLLAHKIALSTEEHHLVLAPTEAVSRKFIKCLRRIVLTMDISGFETQLWCSYIEGRIEFFAINSPKTWVSVKVLLDQGESDT